MKALVLNGVRQIAIREVPAPSLTEGGALIRVHANGVCRSDWHAWVGDIPREYPVILGHEMTGVVEEVGWGVSRFKKGDRVVVPFSGGDGTCELCQSGHSNLCESALIAGKAYSGGYAEYVNVPLADRNVVHLPEEISFGDGAALGCRFMTSFHGLVDRAEVRPGEFVVVFGCGGVGLSAVNIAASLGATVIGVDINPENLKLAEFMGAEFIINSRDVDAVQAVAELTKGGAHVAVDALGIAQTCVDAIRSLRKQGRHLQVGLTTQKEAGHIAVPIDLIVRKELKVIGSLGMSSHRFPAMMSMVARGVLTPGRMVTGEIGLSGVERVFEDMSNFSSTGTYVVTKFS
ncbi:MAG: alcohol dehydrogenase catalytic domain-containing protein [Nevskia sp.]|nr:alcohol dehydrogenase catalytic domain-containing protein [Nevskia sp.]